MFMDGVSLPGLSEKVMYQTCYSKLKKPKKPKLEDIDRFDFPIKRFNGYKDQDIKAGRQYDLDIDY
ncbi:hypothetical protein L917_09310, partial [Phytophthora nicotianae]